MPGLLDALRPTGCVPAGECQRRLAGTDGRELGPVLDENLLNDLDEGLSHRAKGTAAAADEGDLARRVADADKLHLPQHSRHQLTFDGDPGEHRDAEAF